MLPVNDDKTEELAQLVHEHIVRQSNLTADTSIILSVQQWLMMTIFIFSIAGSVVGAFWFFKSELISVRVDLTHAIEKLDSVWLNRTRDMTDDIKDYHRSALGELRQEVSELKYSIPSSFPPSAWLQDVYSRDITELKSEIKELKEAGRQ